MSSTLPITKTRKNESTKRIENMRTTDEGCFEDFPIRDLEKEKGKHQFEDLSKKIIGAALEVQSRIFIWHNCDPT